MDFAGKKVLVTGANGFKGSWLSAALIRLEARVYGTVTPRSDPRSAWSHLDMMKDMVYIPCDVSDRQATYDMLNAVEPEIVFHLAAKAIVTSSLRDPRRTYEVNVIGTINLLEACRKLGVTERIVICSTDHVFGGVSPQSLPRDGFRESDAVNYSGPYDTSKAAMELIVRSYHNTYWDELPGIAITRCANVFGIGDVNQGRVLPRFVRAALEDKVIPIQYRKNGRQFIHVTDAIAGYLRVAKSINEGSAKTKRGAPPERSPFTPTYHFAIEEYSEDAAVPYILIETLAQRVGRILDAKVMETKDCIDYAPRQNPVQALNCGATKKSLAWAPLKPFDQAIRELAHWSKNETEGKRRSAIEKDIQAIIEAAT